VTELAAWSRSFTTVYLYDTLGDDSTEFITNHAEIAFLVCSADKAERVLALAPRCPKLRYLIVMGGGGSLLAAAVRCFVFCWFLGADLFSKKAGPLKVISFAEVLRIGAQVLAQGTHPASVPQPPLPADMLTILYTSGTTGPPKVCESV
jgi:long-chain acyl-CoA synthetase